MAFINCPECKTEFSDKAEACPKCGFKTSYFDIAKKIRECKKSPCFGKMDVLLAEIESLDEKLHGWVGGSFALISGAFAIILILFMIFFTIVGKSYFVGISSILIGIAILVKLSKRSDELNNKIALKQECLEKMFLIIPINQISGLITIESKQFEAGNMIAVVLEYAYKIGADAVAMDGEYSSTHVGGSEGNVSSSTSHHARAIFLKLPDEQIIKSNEIITKEPEPVPVSIPLQETPKVETVIQPTNEQFVQLQDYFNTNNISGEYRNKTIVELFKNKRLYIKANQQ